jgi:hypothetical protein
VAAAVHGGLRRPFLCCPSCSMTLIATSRGKRPARSAGWVGPSRDLYLVAAAPGGTLCCGNRFHDPLPEGFRHFVASIPAPVASGWSGCRVGLAPTGKHRLVTAHTHSGRCEGSRTPLARSRGGVDRHGEALNDRSRTFPMSIDQRVLDGKPSGNSRAGRRLFTHLGTVGVDVIATICTSRRLGASTTSQMGSRCGEKADH